MMSKVAICPTVTAFDNHQYREQMELVTQFAERIHIDLMDGEFAPSKSPGLEHVWWPEAVIADIHLMYQRPMEQLETLIKLKPNLVVVHAEADLNPAHFAMHLRDNGIKAGLALLAHTSAELIEPLLPSFDHVLVFSGKLGFHGGQADLSNLEKVKALRQAKPGLEISWDGGINADNAKQLVEAGIDVLNVGGFIAKAEDPAMAYSKLAELL